MSYSNSEKVSMFTENSNPASSLWKSLLLGLFCSIFLPGCGDGAGPSKLDREMGALDSETASERETALMHLTGMGKEKAESAAPKAVELLKDENAAVRAAAVALIASFEHKTPEALAGLADLASGDTDADVQQNAMIALNDLGAHEQHVEAAKALLASDDGDKRCAAANALSEAGEHAAAVQTELIAGLMDTESCVREYCALALGNLGAKASAEAKAALADAAGDKESTVAEAVKTALENLNK